ncbi:hypothetical protein RHMOL_Rhmol01G0183300 [Rhododendron molle]|uniref:Uncharacterized protein n=1 Tax=Rhododendron molle TaxID=49168 RepID=A0ACC0Q3C9_RHOML|nr:hypothetical protein RHMOL_Rhmol01G0183300 [Rhododendron molle]
MSSLRQGGCPPFTPQVLADYRSLLAPEYPRPTPPFEDDMELYEVPITWETPPLVAIPEDLPPTQVPAPPVKDVEQPFSFSTFGMETDPELEMAMLNLSQYYLEPLEEPPVLTMEEMIVQERDRLFQAKTDAERSYKMWLRELLEVALP